MSDRKRRKGKQQARKPPSPPQPPAPAPKKTYGIKFISAADKEFAALDGSVKPRIAKALEKLKDDPRHSGCERLSDADKMMRVRVGDWRVLYTIRDEEILVVVLRVQHRGEDYRGLPDLVEMMRRLVSP